ncbi:MAG: hypothetical protein K2G23_00535, partial [Muribaculaceae bacterium]|nr:hypothetical protein [Muribaculaceae bacterium]
FCNYVNVKNKFPYTPNAATIDIVNRIKAILDTHDLDSIEKECLNIFQYLSNCRQRYEKGECDYICHNLTELLPQLKSWEFNDENDLIVQEIIIQDIEQRLKSVNNWINNS